MTPVLLHEKVVRWDEQIAKFHLERKAQQYKGNPNGVEGWLFCKVNKEINEKQTKRKKEINEKQPKRKQSKVAERPIIS